MTPDPRSNETTNEARVEDLREPAKGELVPMESTAGLIASGELDQQIATAKKYPRNITHFRQEAMSLATLNEQVAGECLFALRRENADGTVKIIEGPSVRLAEIIAYCWGNCRIGSRIVLEGQESVVVQGVFQDVQRNVVQTSEVSRGIVNRSGRRFKRDMITVTTNAAQAIARRNAIATGVPRALWWDVYQAARKVAAGDVKSLAAKVKDAVAAFAVYGITLPQILLLLERESEIEITREDVLTLIGVFRAIKDEEVTPEDAFPPPPTDVRLHKEGNGKKEADPPTTEGPSLKPPTQGIAPAGIAPPEDQVPAPNVRHAEVPAEDRPATATDAPAPRRGRRAAPTVE